MVRMSRAGALDHAVAEENAPSKTLADRLREQVSDEILRGVLVPGIPLEEVELARRFDVSRTPVREAIRLLVASGLVEARPHRGAVVARATQSQLAAMFHSATQQSGQ